jgi:N-acetylglucosaminyl-diphospho-decaprenol L-rhamnosyltransferase
MPKITVVVVNFNGGEYLLKCIESLSRQTFPNFETIIVDNASTDGSIETLERLPANCRIIKSATNLGFAAANNLAARAGHGEWLALLNPDAEAMPDWLDELMAAVEVHPGHRMVASLQISMDDPDYLDGAGDCYLAFGFAWRGGFGHFTSRAPGAGTCFAPCGAAALYPRQLFLDAGGFDENYFCYHEDVDLGFRLRLMGESCQFAPGARVVHAGSAIAGRRSDFSVFYGSRNSIWTFLKNTPSLLLIAMSPIWLAGTIALLIRWGLVGRLCPAIKGVLAALIALPYIVRARCALKKKRRASLISIARAMSWAPKNYLMRRPDVRAF